MQFKRLNRDTGERVFVVMQANEANIAADDVVALEMTAASVDGVKIVQPNTNELNGVVGIADAAIANGAYGLVQVYGYRSTSRITISGSSMFPGACLRVAAGDDTLHTAATIAQLGLYPAFHCLESLASTTETATVSKKIFIRCM